jgi:hypothetical protein
MYVLGLSPSWGTSRICPAWSPSELNRLRLCLQSGARVRSHAVRRSLFIELMTAAHISPNVFSLQNFLSNINVLFFIIHSPSFILIIHHIQASNYILLLHNKSTLSFLRLFIAGQLPSVSHVRYKYSLETIIVSECCILLKSAAGYRGVPASRPTILPS